MFIMLPKVLVTLDVLSVVYNIGLMCFSSLYDV